MESAQHPQAAARVGPENRLTVSLLMVWTFAVAVVQVWHQPWGVETLTPALSQAERGRRFGFF